MDNDNERENRQQLKVKQKLKLADTSNFLTNKNIPFTIKDGKLYYTGGTINAIQ